ncbi:PD-(D/E)XK nuclease family protein [Methylacidiphilum caldifontis]|uniref:PD-(D/E)XK nuclease family protein n=1 Tax=Methylacidiphilum caldifontis TaxID=2795386 RepID=UPI001A8D0D1E|nr:PD-(D/E)XK nuclease family protein [Methylacidiphilum caldifontis]QSR89127.1 PD-(D/E)XK nuclease family protein [Methylacidiphilum caldifontis]
MDFERQFLGVQDPFPVSVVEWLSLRNNHCLDKVADFSEFLVIVPTRFSALMLVEAIKNKYGQGFVLPTIITPMTLFEIHPDGWLDLKKVASRMQRKLAWVSVLNQAFQNRVLESWSMKSGDFENLLSLTTVIIDTQDELAEKNLTLKDLSSIQPAEEGFHKSLALLEQEYFSTLGKRGLIDPFFFYHQLLQEPKLPPAIKNIVVAGCLDPNPLAIKFLEGLKEFSKIDVLLPATSDLAPFFDAKGLPIEDSWRELTIPISDECIHLYGDEIATVKEIVKLISGENYEEATTIGLCREQGTAILKEELKKNNIPFFDYSGISYKETPFYDFFLHLKELLNDPSWNNLSQFIRSPLYYEWFQKRYPGKFDTFLSSLDRFTMERIPLFFDDLGESPPETQGLVSCVNRFLDGLKSDQWPQKLLSFFAEALENFSESFQEIIPQWSSLLTTRLEQFCLLAPSIAPADCRDFLSLMLDEMNEERLFYDRKSPRLELKGWLELLWDDASHLVLAGFQEGDVPKSIGTNMILDEERRKQLGLKSQEMRLTRDGLLLRYLSERLSRRGRIDIFLSKRDSDGEVLYPSRLLFLLKDKELPRRVSTLFSSLPSQTIPRGKTDSFKLKLPSPSLNNKECLSVSALNDYLSCPFYFYIKHRLGWQPLVLPQAELIESDFGRILHEVLTFFGKNYESRELVDPDQIFLFLSDQLEKTLTNRYGKTRTLALHFQQKAMLGRLKTFSLFQAARKKEGWQIVDVEKPVELEIEGMLIRGRIDRIDQREEEFQIIDYKAMKAQAPFRTHLKSVRSNEELPPTEAYFLFEGKKWRWLNFQLPLYYHGLKSVAAGKSLTVAFYFLSHREENDLLKLWPVDKSHFLEESTKSISKVVKAIKENKFWPPNPKADIWRYPSWNFWFDSSPEEIFEPPI